MDTDADIDYILQVTNRLLLDIGDVRMCRINDLVISSDYCGDNVYGLHLSYKDHSIEINPDTIVIYSDNNVDYNAETMICTEDGVSCYHENGPTGWQPSSNLIPPIYYDFCQCMQCYNLTILQVYNTKFHDL